MVEQRAEKTGPSFWTEESSLQWCAVFARRGVEMDGLDGPVLEKSE